MKVIFLIFAIFIFRVGYSQSNGKLTPVYFEKLKAGFDFKTIGDSLVYNDFCITNDSCFTRIKIFLLDDVGSYKMSCYDTQKGYTLVYTYKGDKKLCTNINESSVDLDGNIIKKTKKKMFTPSLIKSELLETQ